MTAPTSPAPTPLMPADVAEQIRAAAPDWLRALRVDLPRLYSLCACQFWAETSGVVDGCNSGHHDLCPRGTPLPLPYGHVRRPDGAIAYLPEPYEHPTTTVVGRAHQRAAMVWLADRVCRWVCACTCHTAAPAPAPEPRPAASRPRPVRTVPLAHGQEALL